MSENTNREEIIKDLLTRGLKVQHLEVVNESHMHSRPGNDTHYKILVVSEEFEGKNRVQRQRLIHEILAEEFNKGLHALTQRALTPKEWAQTDLNSFKSPACKNRD